MQTFRIKPNGYSEISSKVLLRVSLQLLIIFPVAMLIPFVLLLQAGGLEAAKEMFLIIGPCLMILFIVGMYLAHRKFKKRFEGTILTVTDTEISLAQPQLPIFTMNFDDIKEIKKVKTGSFIISAFNTENIMIIPSQMMNYEELETTLESIKPISVQDIDTKDSLWVRYSYTIHLLCTLALITAFFLVTNKLLVGLLGAILITYLTLTYIKLRKSTMVSASFKRMSLKLVFVIFLTVILKMTDIFEKLPDIYNYFWSHIGQGM
jgi:hypothetical protein